MDKLEQTQDKAQLDLDKAKDEQSAVNGGDSESQGEQKNQGVVMVASPLSNDDKEVNLFDDPENRTGKQKFTDAPFTVKADPNDIKKTSKSTFIKILSIPKHPEAKPAYAYKQSIRNTDAAFQALDFFNITGEERNVFMANADHESGGGTALTESTKYTNAFYWGSGSEKVTENGEEVTKTYKGINNQTRAITKGYIDKYTNESRLPTPEKRKEEAENKFKSLFSTWSAEKIGNYMYGIEGAELAESLNQTSSDGWIYKGMDNVNTGDGYKYRGRTSVQITGRNAYQKLHDKLNSKAEEGSDVTVYEKYTGKKGSIDVIGNPDVLVQDEYLSYFASAEFWDRVSRRRITNTLKTNNLGDKNSLNSLTNSKKAVLVGRKSIAGESTDLTVEPLGLDDTQKKYDKNHAAYDEAYAEYSAGKESNDGTQTEPAAQNTEEPQAPEAPVPEAPAPEVTQNEIDIELSKINIDVNKAIEFNNKHNSNFCSQLQEFIGAPKSGVFDEKTVKYIALWQKNSKLNKVDGKFGDKSLDAAIKQGFSFGGTLLDEVVITADKSTNKPKGSNDTKTDKVDAINLDAGKKNPDKADEKKAESDDTTNDDDIVDTGEDFGTLKLNSDKKTAVKILQKYLNKNLAHYSQIPKLNTDGSYGEKTYKSVGYYQYSRNLQNSCGIDVDGICGSNTWKALRENKAEVYDITQPKVFSKFQNLGPYSGVKISAGGTMCSEAAAAFEKMSEAAVKAGFSKIKQDSTYRGMTNFETKTGSDGGGSEGQIELFYKWKGNTKYCANPGKSNHQQGRAIDISGLDSGTAPLYYWLHDNTKGADGKYTTNTNCMSGKKNRSGFSQYSAETWHWDYVGKPDE